MSIVTFSGGRQEQTKYGYVASIEDVQSQSETDKNEHLNNIVHEIIDNLELVDVRKQDGEEKKNEHYFVSIITSEAPTDTQSGQKNEAEIDRDNKATFIEMCNPSNSAGPQNDMDKNSEITQEIKQSDLEVQNIDNLEQVETHETEVETQETNVAETIEENSSQVQKDKTADNIETSCKQEIKPEKEDLIVEKNKETSQSQICQVLEKENMKKTSIFENHSLQFVMFIGNNSNNFEYLHAYLHIKPFSVAVFIFYFTFFISDEEGYDVIPKVQNPSKLVRATQNDVIQVNF